MTPQRDRIKCPYCPYCGAEPHMAWLELTPWFCPNDDCDVFGWDPYVSAKVNIDSAEVVQLVNEDSKAHKPPQEGPHLRSVE